MVDTKQYSEDISEVDLKNFFELSIDMLCLAGTDGYFKAVSPAFTQILGWTKEELLSKPFIDFVLPEDKEATLKVLADLGKGSSLTYFENRYSTKNGDFKWLGWSAFPTAEGRIYAIARDVSERKRFESELETRSKLLKEQSDELEKFKFAVENSFNHIILTDVDGHILFANSAAEQMTGYVLKEMLGRTPALWGKQMKTEFYQTLWHTIKVEKKPFHGEVTNKRKDGTLYSAIATISPIFNEESVLIGFIGIEEDVSKLKEVDRLKSEFISIASHQLRTPLTGIKWVAERFLEKEQMSEKGREYMNDIQNSINQLNLLVETLLNTSRLESGKVGVVPQPVELITYINKFISECRPLVEKKNLTLRFDTHPEKLDIETDLAALRNIVQSLISNAIEYTPEGGSIGIFVEAKENDFLFRVQDTGIGIPKAEQKEMFKKFNRASNAKMIKASGTGLGLYIAGEAVKILGGSVRFDSEEGRGTTFFVELPIKAKAVEGEKKFL